MKKIATKAPKTPAQAKTAPITEKPLTPKAVAPAKVVPVPAPKVAVAAAAPAAKAKAKATAKKPVAQPAPIAEAPVVVAPAPDAPAAPAIKAPSPEVLASTTISAQIDIGFGNQLFVRGEGGGLSWDKGIAMDNVSADRWQLVLSGSSPVIFKFLLNDLSWSLGDDYTAAPGSTVAFAPLF
jgi:hypothetical protein